MFRLLILLISLVWASLMLISWSGAPTHLESSDIAVSSSARS